MRGSSPGPVGIMLAPASQLCPLGVSPACARQPRVEELQGRGSPGSFCACRFAEGCRRGVNVRACAVRVH